MLQCSLSRQDFLTGIQIDTEKNTFRFVFDFLWSKKEINWKVSRKSSTVLFAWCVILFFISLAFSLLENMVLVNGFYFHLFTKTTNRMRKRWQQNIPVNWQAHYFWARNRVAHINYNSNDLHKSPCSIHAHWDGIYPKGVYIFFLISIFEKANKTQIHQSDARSCRPAKRANEWTNEWTTKSRK